MYMYVCDRGAHGQFINRTVTVHAASTSSAYAVENTKPIKEQKRRLSEIKFKGGEKLK